jgi:hypothetical protein
MARRASARRRSGASQWRADFKVFFDVSVEEEPVGRLVFSVPSLDSLARSTRNFKAITKCDVMTHGKNQACVNTSMHKECAYTYTFGSIIFVVAAHALSLPCTSLKPTEKMFVVDTSWMEPANLYIKLQALVTGERRALDPALSYKGCSFAYGPQYVLQRSGNNAGTCMPLSLSLSRTHTHTH